MERPSSAKNDLSLRRPVHHIVGPAAEEEYVEVVVEEDPGQASGVVPAPRRRQPTLPVQREQDEPSQNAGDDARAEGDRPSLTVWRTGARCSARR